MLCGHALAPRRVLAAKAFFEFNFLAALQLVWLTKSADGINVDIEHCNFHEPATPQIWRQESLLLLYSEVVPNLLERQKHVENLGAWNASLAQSAKLCEGTFKLPKKTHLFIATGKDEKGVSSCFFPSADCFVQKWIRKHTPNIVWPCRGRGSPKKVKLLADQRPWSLPNEALKLHWVPNTSWNSSVLMMNYVARRTKTDYKILQM